MADEKTGTSADAEEPQENTVNESTETAPEPEAAAEAAEPEATAEPEPEAAGGCRRRAPRTAGESHPRTRRQEALLRKQTCP